MTLHEAHPPAPIALDTNLFVRATVRRMLCGAQELCGSHVLVPAEVARECDVPYAAVAGRRSRREADGTRANATDGGCGSRRGSRRWRPTCASPSARAQRRTAAWTSKTLSRRLRGDVGAEGDRRMDFQDGPRQSTARNAERPSSAPSPPPGPGRVSPGRRCGGLSRRPGGDAPRMTVDERNRISLPGIDIGLRLR